MKKWTVMLIPQGTGPTRNLNLSTFHLWSSVAMLLCLSFTAGFLYQRQQASAHKVALLREAMFELQQENVIQPSIDGPAPDAEDAPDADLRAEYEAREAAITSELRDLYDLEQEVRQLTGLPPRDAELEPATPFPEEGKGGGPEEAAPSSRGPQTLAVRPAQLIYSTSRPSADLILQEIALRRTSMQSLISDLKVQQDRIERTPSTWPIRLANRHISSRFGYRKDPFTRRLRYHSGTDIGAPTGTPIHATAKGRVVYSGRDSDYGNLVKIDHGDGLQTWYAHMHRRGVTVGDVVQRGQEIGAVGNTGRSTGPHLHYEVRVQGVAVNAEKYLGN